ncbi:MAG: xanthine dehydrogenase family protein molybdopterin-binding subunit [Acidimicrobiales bacterium]
MDEYDLPTWPPGTDLETAGTGETRREAPAKVTGGAVYSSDLRLPGQLYTAIARSPHPHARVRSIDADRARGLPGVVAVIGGEEGGEGVTWYEESVPLFSPVARFAGDEVAAVAATSLEAARDAVRALHVDYEVLPHVVGIDGAQGPEAPSIHGTPANRTADPKVEERGDVAAALAAAPVVIEHTYRTPTAVHNALETHGSAAWWQPDRLTIWASTQGVTQVARMTAKALGLDQSQVRVITEHVGGGFGAKQVPWKDVAIAALLSRRTGRPVRCAYDRHGENVAAGKRGATRQRVRIGADTDGHLLAIDAELVGDSGAYQTAGEAAALWGPYQGLYHCANVRTSVTYVYTNTGPAVAFRAPGYVEAAFALESAMDELARRVDVDPIELRRRNHTGIDQQQGRPWSSPDSLPLIYDRISALAGWDGRPRPAPPADDGVYRGWGFATSDWLAGKPSPPGYASVELRTDGSAEVVTTVQDIGTGTRTMLAQVAAEELQLPADEVRVTVGDTAAGPPSPTSSGSATTPTMAPAVRAAAADARRQLVEAAARQLDCPAAEVTLDHGKLVAANGDTRTVAEVLEAMSPAAVHGWGQLVEADDSVSVRTFGAAVAEVSVDTGTGEVRVTRVVSVPDCGRVLNPRLVKSQIIGGVTQGIGFALTESQVLDADLGLPVNDSLEEYLVPTVLDICPIEAEPLDRPDTVANQLGVKGIGEPPMIPVAPAIANAVFDAIGIRFHELPLTRRRVLDALAGAGPPGDGVDRRDGSGGGPA